MPEADRLGRLLTALTLITGRSQVVNPMVTLGDLGVDSRHLVELMAACDEVYGSTIPFEQLDITTDTSVHSLDEQISLSLGR